jgi:hypothetical protein
MPTVQIFLKSGQTIVLKDSEVVQRPDAEGVGFATPRGTVIHHLNLNEIAAVISEDEWS